MRYQSLIDLLEAEKETFISNCTRCGLCLEDCPVFPLLEISHLSTSDAQQERINVLSGGPVAKDVYDMVWACSRCSSCLHSCPEGLNPFLLQYMLRSELVRCGHAPPESPPRQQYEPLSDVRILSNVPSESQKRDVVYFSGCNAPRYPQIVSITLDIFDDMEIDYLAFVGSIGNLCCGSPYLTVGEPEKAEKVARNLISAVTRFSPEKLILKCPACMNRLSNLFSEIMDFDFEIQYISEFLNENPNRINFTHGGEKNITLHDCCNLGRGCGDYESVRRLLKSIPGIHLMEMANNRENASCCGLSTSRWYPEIGPLITEQTLTDAENTGARSLVTTCGFCRGAFSMWEDKHGSKLPFQIEDFLAIVAEAMGIIEDKNRVGSP